jgi:flagellar motor switch protein FliM
MTAGSIQSASARESLQGLFGAAQGGLERLPLLRQALEGTGPACAEEVRAMAAAPVRLVLKGIDNGNGADVLAPGRGDRALAVLVAADWRAQLFASADRGAVFAMLEAMLGGDGSQAAHAAERPLSKVEADVAGLFFAAIARGLAASFAPIAASAFEVAATAEEIDFDRIERDFAVVIATYRLETLERGGEVQIAIPHAALGGLRKTLSQAPAKAAPQPDPGWAQHIRKEVTRTHVTLTAILDERPGLLAEVLNLQVGQVVELQATAQSRVRVECNGERLMWCDFGKSNGAYTLRVDNFVDREQEFMDDILVA